jgi:hypothetical protein
MPELEELLDGTMVDVELIINDEVLPGGGNRSRAMSLDCVFLSDLPKEDPRITIRETYFYLHTLLSAWQLA